MQRLLKLKKVLKNSVLATLAEGVKAAKASGGKFRSLTPEEIASLEGNGNRCEDWNRVQVEANFDPARVRNSVFMGDVKLAGFYGTLLLPGDVSFPTGVYDSLVCNSIIENALVYIQGNFNEDALIIKSGATIGDSDKDDLRLRNIILGASQTESVQ